MLLDTGLPVARRHLVTKCVQAANVAGMVHEKSHLGTGDVAQFTECLPVYTGPGFYPQHCMKPGTQAHASNFNTIKEEAKLSKVQSSSAPMRLRLTWAT